jgi:hypothetical protein
LREAAVSGTKNEDGVATCGRNKIMFNEKRGFIKPARQMNWIRASPIVPTPLTLR